MFHLKHHSKILVPGGCFFFFSFFTWKNEPMNLSRTLKDLRFYSTYKLMSYPITIFFLSQFYRGWQKSWEFWITKKKKKTSTTHSNNINQSASTCDSSPSLNFYRVTLRGPGDNCAWNGLHYRKGTLSLGNLNLYNNGQ